MQMDTNRMSVPTLEMLLFIYLCFLLLDRYKVEVVGKSLPVLTNTDKGKYGVIIFENLNRYLGMDKWNRELLDKYCLQYQVRLTLLEVYWQNP